MAELGALTGAVLESLPWCCGSRRANGLSSSAATQSQSQSRSRSSELAHLKTYAICKWLGHVNRPVLLFPKLQDLHNRELLCGPQTPASLPASFLRLLN